MRCLAEGYHCANGMCLSGARPLMPGAPGCPVSQLLPGGVWVCWARYRQLCRNNGLGAMGEVREHGIPVARTDYRDSYTFSFCGRWCIRSRKPGEGKKGNVREEITLKEIYLVRLWPADLVLKWRAQLTEVYTNKVWSEWGISALESWHTLATSMPHDPFGSLDSHCNQEDPHLRSFFPAGPFMFDSDVIIVLQYW